MKASKTPWLYWVAWMVRCHALDLPERQNDLGKGRAAEYEVFVDGHCCKYACPALPVESRGREVG